MTCDACLRRSSPASGVGVGDSPNKALSFDTAVATGTMSTAKEDTRDIRLANSNGLFM